MKINSKLIGEFAHASQLLDLNLSYNLIGKAGIEFLWQAFASVKEQSGIKLRLQSLILRGNLLDNESHLSLIPFLNHLDHLDLSENPLKDIFF